jgi:hypothetical protein
VISHPGVVRPTNVFWEQFATKAVKLLETNAVPITSVSADAVKITPAQNLTFVYRNASSTQTVQLAAAPSDFVVTQICVMEENKWETFVIKIRNVKWVIAILEQIPIPPKFLSLQIIIIVQ